MDNRKFILITGPMFSGKTEELLRIANRYQIAGKIPLILKPKTDKRHGNSVVVSHNNNASVADIISNFEDIFPILENYKLGYNAVFIDEFQFVKNVTIEKVRHITETLGIPLYVCGLVLDSFRVPFETMKTILPFAEIIQLESVCDFCGEFNAKYTYRENSETTKQVLVGGKDLYKAICLTCLLRKNKHEKLLKIADKKA